MTTISKENQSFMHVWEKFIEDLQDRICASLVKVNNGHEFLEDKWERPGGGGGRTRVMNNGPVIEKGGVNISHVWGAVTPQMQQFLKIEKGFWSACGLSMVLHPSNPHVPTYHANWRYFELKDEEGNIVNSWFGGGMDLTPYYLYEADAIHFHQMIKDAMDPHHQDCYRIYKKECDDYFSNHHRNEERRGIGGVFYDHLVPDNNAFNWSLEDLYAFQRSNSDCFFKAYIPIVEKRMHTAFTEQQKYWQEIRRGRYVEFNLLHDRGTLFGIKSDGRTESILMSLPPTVRFDYDYSPAPGSPESELMDVLLSPKDWI